MVCLNALWHVHFLRPIKITYSNVKNVPSAEFLKATANNRRKGKVTGLFRGLFRSGQQRSPHRVISLRI